MNTQNTDQNDPCGLPSGAFEKQLAENHLRVEQQEARHGEDGARAHAEIGRVDSVRGENFEKRLEVVRYDEVLVDTLERDLANERFLVAKVVHKQWKKPSKIKLDACVLVWL